MNVFYILYRKNFFILVETIFRSLNRAEVLCFVLRADNEEDDGSCSRFGFRYRFAVATVKRVSTCTHVLSKIHLYKIRNVFTRIFTSIIGAVGILDILLMYIYGISLYL